MTQEIGINRDSDEENSIGSLSLKKRGYGFGTTALYKLRGGQDSLSLGLTYGNGIGRYFNYIEGAFLDEANNRLLLEKAVGIVAGYQYKHSDTLRANFVYGWQQNINNSYSTFALDNDLGSGQYGINKRLYQAHAGLIYTPVKNVDLGAEYIFGQRTTLKGEKGDLSRLNLMARYTFN